MRSIFSKLYLPLLIESMQTFKKEKNPTNHHNWLLRNCTWLANWKRTFSLMVLSISWLSFITYWFLMQKICSDLYRVSRANTHHDVTDFRVDGMFQNTKLWISWVQCMTFSWNKIFLLNCISKITLSEITIF